jgi:hypothetical protein
MGVVAFFEAVTAEQLDSFLAEPEKLEAFLETSESGIDIDKAHEGIACLLRRASSDAALPVVEQAIFGGADTAVLDAYGCPVRYLNPEQVAAVADALSGISAEDLRAAYSAEALSVVDEDGAWLWENREQALGYLLPHYDALAEFYRAAARAGKAILQSET